MKRKKSKPLYFRKSFLSEIPLILLNILMIPLVVHLSNEHPASIISIPIIENYSIPFPLFALFPILCLIILFKRVYNYRYIIEDTHMRSVHGLLSLHKKDMRIEYRDVLGIDIERNLIERIFNVGDIEIGTAMLGEAEIVFYGVYNPSKYRAMIIKKVDAAPAQTNIPHIKKKIHRVMNS